MIRLIAVRASVVFALVFASSQALAVPYQVHMDNVNNLLNWSYMDDDVGDLYDSGGVKQVEVSYHERSNFGNTPISAADPQFWNSLEYGDYHRALFADAGGTEVLEVEITGLNGNLVSLDEVLMGRWFPDGLNSLDSDWAVYDGNWNLLLSGNTVMQDYIDYVETIGTAEFETVRFQMGEDNWDNGLIAFTYSVDVIGTLDLAIDDTSAPTPSEPGSGPTTVPGPASVLLLLAGLLGLTRGRFSRN